MYAVIKTGGKQYRVAKNDVIKIERLAGEAGAEIVFSEVLMLGGDNPASARRASPAPRSPARCSSRPRATR